MTASEENLKLSADGVRSYCSKTYVLKLTIDFSLNLFCIDLLHGWVLLNQCWTKRPL